MSLPKNPLNITNCMSILKFRTNATWEENSKEIMNDGIAYAILLSINTFIQLIAGIFAVDCFNRATLRQITQIRIRYFQSLMRQEIGWFDTCGNDDNFTVHVTE